MKKNGNKYYTDTLAGMLAFGLFAACIILALLAGAGAYRRLTERDRAAYDKRTCTQYIATKIENAQSPEAVSVVDNGDGGSVLRIEENVGDEIFATYIYCRDGWICELLIPSEAVPVYSAGERLLEADALSFSMNDGLIRAGLSTQGGQKCDLMISLDTGINRGAENEK